MRARLAALLILLASAIAAVPAGAQVEGRYQLVSINANALPAESPTEDGVTIHRAVLTLRPDGAYEMQAHADDGEEPPSESSAGRWRSAGDTLRLFPADVPEEEGLVFLWAAADDTLHLTDEFGHGYAFARGQPSGAGEPWSSGTWHARHINGRKIPAPWPLHPEVTITNMTLVFTADGQATIRLAGTREGESTDEEYTAPYQVTGDQLTIRDEAFTVDEEFTWELRDGKLELVDHRGVVYLLARP